MTHSVTEDPAVDSPSTPTPSRSTVTAPPLRVTSSRTTETGSSSPTRSSMTDPDGGDGGGMPTDPLDTSIPLPEAEAPKPAAGSHSLKDMARGIVLAASARVAAAVSKGDPDVVEAAVATEKEQKAIGDPLAQIAGRHMKETAGNPDIGDLIVAGIAALGYAFRVVTAVWNIKRHKAALAAATNDPAETEGA